MLFDELRVQTVTHNDELYINVSQLSSHLKKAIDEFFHESKELSKIYPLAPEEKVFITGLMQGMGNVALMLSQGEAESQMNSISTVEDLLKKFKDNDSHE